jgi:hypothetical protein
LKKNHLTKAVVVLSAVLGTATANAQSMNNSTNIYIGAELGYTTVSDNAQLLANNLVNTVGGSAAVTQNLSVAIGRLFAGYKLNENFALELGYGASSNVNYNFSGVSRGNVAYTGTASDSVSGLDYVLVARPSVSSGLNNLYFKAGGTYYTDKVTTTASTSVASATTTFSSSGTGYLLGAGYDIPLGQDLDFRVSYSYLNNIAGLSGSYANVFSVGILKKF